MTHLIVSVVASPENHVIFAENLQRANLHVDAREGWCTCSATTKFHLRELKLYEIYFSDRSARAAWMYLEDWFVRGQRIAKFIAPFAFIFRRLGFEVFDPKKKKLAWSSQANFRNEILLSRKRETVVPCAHCKGNIYTCDI